MRLWKHCHGSPMFDDCAGSPDQVRVFDLCLLEQRKQTQLYFLPIHMMEAVQSKVPWRSSTITAISVQRHYLHASVFIHSISRRIIGFAVCPVQKRLFVSAQLSNTHNDNSRINNAIRNSAFLSISYHLFKIMLPFLVLRYKLLGLLQFTILERLPKRHR